MGTYSFWEDWRRRCSDELKSRLPIRSVDYGSYLPVFLISPSKPPVRRLDYGSYRVYTHQVYRDSSM